ncbi:hypothetical protein FGIG_01578 [Fasciola gigantica]|uniref:Secreted protein n=1 Tax=Fasciola gigantica TaxID=46835 RepID=A0A504YWD2_FASGI|nr:hypothetical protein FGIG_01578 [Fasciola gigantica]
MIRGKCISLRKVDLCIVLLFLIAQVVTGEGDVQELQQTIIEATDTCLNEAISGTGIESPSAMICADSMDFKSAMIQCMQRILGELELSS